MGDMTKRVRQGVLGLVVWIVVGLPSAAALELAASQEHETDDAAFTTQTRVHVGVLGPTVEPEASGEAPEAMEEGTETGASPAAWRVESETSGAVEPVTVRSAADPVLDEAVRQEDTLRATLDLSDDAPHAGETARSALAEPVTIRAVAVADADEGTSLFVSASAAGTGLGATASPVQAIQTLHGPWRVGWGGGTSSPAGPTLPDETAPEPYVLAAPGSEVTIQGGQVAFPTGLAVAAVVAATVAAGMAAAGAGAAVMPGWRRALTRALKATPGLGLLFSRISKDEALDHPSRHDIFQFIQENPGERVEMARRRLGLANGTMLHHLRILCDKDLVRKVKQGGITRLYPAGPRIRPSPYVIPQRRRVLGTVVQRPGLPQREIGRRLAMSERMVSYHVRHLAQDGLLHVQRDGGRNRCFPAAPPEHLAQMGLVPTSP